MTPVLDLFDSSAHQEDGSSQWWYKRVDNNGNEILLGELSCIKIIDGGNGYSSPPQVVINGGGGNGASAEAVTYHGKIAAINITNPGGGYNSIPRIDIVGSGSGVKVSVFISDGWHQGFARMKSDIEFGQDETPVYDEAKRLFACKKNELKGILKFTSLQDDYFTENFLSKEVYKYNWAVFQNCGLSRDNFVKFRYFGIVRIPRIYRSVTPGRVPEMKGIVLINGSEIAINSQSLPVIGLNGNYSVSEGDGYSVQEEVNF